MRYELLIAGTGGQGVLSLGLIVSSAALGTFRNVLWYPSYDTRQRGGHAETTAILSDEKILSPVLDQAQVLIVMEPAQAAKFQERVLPGGIAIVEKGISLQRSDVRILELPAREVALRLGTMLASNQVYLGAYVQVTKVLAPELIEAELERRYGGREKVLTINKNAFREGMRLATGWKG